MSNPHFKSDVYVSSCRTVVSDTSGHLWVIDPNDGSCKPVKVIEVPEPQEPTDGQAPA